VRKPSAMVQHWRAAGMTYLRYSNTCADLVRKVLKESVKAEKKKVADYSMVRGEWDGGKIIKRGTFSN
jgi:Mitochondrial ATP synthase epsilon chain